MGMWEELSGLRRPTGLSAVHPFPFCTENTCGHHSGDLASRRALLKESQRTRFGCRGERERECVCRGAARRASAPPHILVVKKGPSS